MALDDPDQPHEQTVIFLVAPGDILDERWLIQTRIGQGAMGSVFKGQDLQTKHPVAVKILAPEHCRKPKVLARFEREAQLMTTLRHPNIIQLYGVGRRGALPYIVMEYLEGGTLAEVLAHKGGRLSPGEVLVVVKQIAAGLSFIHHHGLVHRDIKPQNVFVSPNGRVTILDLGVVRDKSNPGLTRKGAIVGTPYYMSPEQIQATDEIDKRTDVYALAAMTFELLVGRPPFLGATNFEVLDAHKKQPVPDASQLNPAVNKDVARVLAEAMSKSREQRPLSASELAANLEAFMGPADKVDPERAFQFLARKPAEKPKRAAAPAPSPAADTDEQQAGPTDFSEGTEAPMARSADVEPVSQDGERPADTLTEPEVAPVYLADGLPDTQSAAATQGGEPEPKGALTSASADATTAAAQRGELRVITTVDGLTVAANLFVEGRHVGQTPKSMLVLVGAHSIRVEREGYPPAERRATVTVGQVALVRIELGA